MISWALNSSYQQIANAHTIPDDNVAPFHDYSSSRHRISPSSSSETSSRYRAILSIGLSYAPHAQYVHESSCQWSPALLGLSCSCLLSTCCLDGFWDGKLATLLISSIIPRLFSCPCVSRGISIWPSYKGSKNGDCLPYSPLIPWVESRNDLDFH